MVNWQYFPRSKSISSLLVDVIKCFEDVESQISSSNHECSSNKVLGLVRSGLETLGFKVETGRKAEERIRVPVLFGLNGRPEKSFEVDAHHKDKCIVLEVEAGRAVTNYQFLKDLFEACMMYEVEYLVLAVRKIYRKRQKDFNSVLIFFDTLYNSGRISLPLEGILIIGY